MGALPLRSLSRLWGYMNSFEVRPFPPRIPSFRSWPLFVAHRAGDASLTTSHLSLLQLPVWARDPGFRLYSWAFGCNLDELAQPDLRSYVSLGDFFYRKLKDGVRPVADVALVRTPRPLSALPSDELTRTCLSHRSRLPMESSSTLEPSPEQRSSRSRG